MFDEIGNNVYLRKDCGISLDTIIYKYTDISTCLDLLERRIRVGKRKRYDDKYECGKLWNPFTERLLPVGQRSTEEDKERWKALEQMRKQTGELFTLCFTLDNVERHFMWKLFASTGVRVAMRLQDFINSITGDNLELYVGGIEYIKRDIGGFKPTRYIFTKKVYYEPEKELRIYFVNKKLPLENQDTIELRLGVCEKLLSEIVLSPYMSSGIKKLFREKIKNDYQKVYEVVRNSRIME